MKILAGGHPMQFINRQQALHKLNQLLANRRSEFAVVYGRRVGKTTLLLHINT